MKTPLAVVTVLLCLTGLAVAHGGHQGKIADLKGAPPSHQVIAAEYCNAVYHVMYKDGSAFDFPEFNLRFKTDSGPNGPQRGTPVQISAGMRGDRAYLVFSDPREISVFIKKSC